LQRIEAVVQSLARFTQLDQAEVRRFDVREGLESAIAVLAPTVSGEVTFERRFAVVPEIEAWPRELNQAFLTVLRNAAEAIDGAGVVTVETRATPEHVLVLVRDTGRGMSADKAAHLFDMAWSAEGERTKMRMGLYAAYASAQKLGGVMEVESAPGRGTTVTFRLPIARR
jgi:signal transduction histidine kinase